MKKILKTVFALLILQVVAIESRSQVVVNGYNPRRYNYSGKPRNAVSISYGYNIWVDGKNVSLPGYSSSLSFFHDSGDPLSVEKSNYSVGINVGYERQVSHKLGVVAAFSASKLITGTSARFDLNATDRSKYTQFGIYARYLLTKNLQHRVQFQWISGPELIIARKDVLIEDYVTDENSDPAPYRQNVSVLEGAIVTGLGISCRLSTSISLFSDSMFGISLPGKGFKSTNTGFGLKYAW